MEDEEKIIKHTTMTDFDCTSEISGLDNISIHNAIEASPIMKDVKIDLSELPYNENNLITIEDFELDQARKLEQKRLEEEKSLAEEIEAQQRIDEPIDLSEADLFNFVPQSEKRVSFKRTFGVTDSKRRDIKKLTGIIIYSLFGLCYLILVIITFATKNQ